MNFDTLDYPVTALEYTFEDVFTQHKKDPWFNKLSIAEPWSQCNVGEAIDDIDDEVIYFTPKAYNASYRPFWEISEYLYDFIRKGALLTKQTSCMIRLEEIQSLEANWDGYDASLVSQEAVFLAKSIISSIGDSFIQKIDSDDIDPTPDGTITIQWNGPKGYFLIEIGKTKVVYFYEFSGCIKGQCTPALYEGGSTLQEIKTLLMEFFSEDKNSEHKSRAGYA